MPFTTSGKPGDPTWVMVTDEEITTDAALNAALPHYGPGTVAHTAGYAILKQKGTDGTWTEIGGNVSGH